MATVWALTDEGYEAFSLLEEKGLDSEEHPVVLVFNILESSRGSTTGEISKSIGLSSPETFELLVSMEREGYVGRVRETTLIEDSD